MADNEQRREFLEEIQLMKAVGSHKNIVNMVGCCTVEEPMFLLTEYIPYGDLLHYLRKRRGKVTNTNSIKSVFDWCSDHSTLFSKAHLTLRHSNLTLLEVLLLNSHMLQLLPSNSNFISPPVFFFFQNLKQVEPLNYEIVFAYSVQSSQSW